MNFVKKFVAVIFCAVVIFSISGCAKKTSTDSQKIVVKALAYGDNANSEGQSWARIVKAFEEANPDVKIDYELLYDEAYHQKVLARLASGDVPHMAYMGADARWGAPWKEARQQYDHRSLLDPEVYDFSKIPAHGPNGEIFYVPLGTTNACSVMFTNTKLLADLGFAEPKTYADIVAMVPKAKAAGIEVVSTHGADSWVFGSVIMSAILARETGDPNWIQKAVKGEKKFTDPDFVAALKVLETMVKDGVLLPKTVQYDDGTAKSNFNSNKVLFHLGGQWEAGGFIPETQKVMKLSAFPVMPGEKGAEGTVAGAMTTGYGVTQAVAKDPKVLDAAMRFINYYNTEAEVIQRWRDGAIVAPILKSYTVPADMPVASIAKAAIADAPVADVIDAYLSGAPNDELNAGMQRIVAGTTTAQQLAEKVESLMKR